MGSKYYIFIPGHLCEKICKLDKLKIQNFHIPNCADKNDADLQYMKLIHKGLLIHANMKNAYYSFIIYDSIEPENEAIININKIMTIFFYCILNDNIESQDPIYDNSLLVYYICTEPVKQYFEEDEFITFHFRFNGIKMRSCSFLKKEKFSYDQSPHRIFNCSSLKYFANITPDNVQEIKAMDRFIAARRSQNDGDYINTYLNLLYAFENIITLHGSDKAKEFAGKIKEYLALDIAAGWAREFYKIRGLIAHGSKKFLWPNFYLNREPINKAERTIYWKHPDGTTYYLPHLYLGAEVFRIIFDFKYFDEKPDSNYIESLFTVNEVIYNKIAILVSSEVPFCREYYNLINSLKLNDSTFNKRDLKLLLNFVIDYVVNESDLNLNTLINKLRDEKEYSPKFNLIIYRISEEISRRREEIYGNVYGEKSFELLKLSDLIRKIYYTFSVNPAL